MAKKGIQCVKYSKIGEDGKYTGPKDISDLVTFNGSPNKVEGEIWGDNGISESNKSVNKINLSMELVDLAAKEYADLCGHNYDEQTKKVEVKNTDNAPYVGIGAIGNSERGGKEVYIMKVYPKMQFGDPNDDNSTEKETIEYKSTTIEGTGYPNDENLLKVEQEFDSLEEAKTALDKFLAAETTHESAGGMAEEPGVGA